MIGGSRESTVAQGSTNVGRCEFRPLRYYIDHEAAASKAARTVASRVAQCFFRVLSWAMIEGSEFEGLNLKVI